MLAVPCGLPTYVGAWPPLVAGAPIVSPLAELAASTPHAACTSGGGVAYGAGVPSAEEPPGEP